MTAVRDKVVAVTGAGSGIGRALAGRLAAAGAHLAISDRDTVGLADTARHVRSAHPGVRVRTDEVDVTSKEGVEAWAAAVAEEYGRVNVVINNAGVAFTGDVVESTLDDLAWVMDVDFWGVVHGTTAFLPYLEASGEGHVVNLSSLFGLIAMPSQSAYVAAKFAVRGWSESLREEMIMRRSPVRVSVVHPGGIKTGIARNARAANGLDPTSLAAFFDSKLAVMSPERAAKIIVRGVERNRGRIMVGADARALHGLERVIGSGYERILAFGAGRANAVAGARSPLPAAVPDVPAERSAS